MKLAICKLIVFIFGFYRFAISGTIAEISTDFPNLRFVNLLFDVGLSII